MEYNYLEISQINNYIKNLIVTDEELVKTTTKKVKRNEEMKKIIKNTWQNQKNSVKYICITLNWQIQLSIFGCNKLNKR